MVKHLLKIQISKRADGAGILTCERADGTTTWQKKTPPNAAHFALHDLTHFAVETTLGYKSGFFGLISEGWEIDDTNGKGASGPLPPEALEVEKIVGLFDQERASANSGWSAEEMNTYSPWELTQEQIDAVRECRDELFRKWSAVGIGGKLELTFELP